MAIVNRNGHGVTTALPGNADAVTVGSVSVPYPQAPANQAGGSSKAQISRDVKGSFPPAGSKSTPNASSKGKQSSSKTTVYGQ